MIFDATVQRAAVGRESENTKGTMGAADASASVDDNVRLVNLAIASIADTTGMYQAINSAIKIDNSVFKGKFNLLDCERVIQTATVNAQQNAQLTDVQSAQTSLLLQMLADAQSKGADNNNSSSASTMASVTLKQRNELYSSIVQNCRAQQTYNNTIRFSDDVFDDDAFITRGITLTQQVTLSCVQTSTVDIMQKHQVHIDQNLTSDATSEGGLDFSSYFALFFVVLVVMMIFSFIRVIDMAIEILLFTGFVGCAVCILYEGMVFGGATADRRSAKKQLDAALSGSKPDDPGWVPSGQACFRRNWFADHKCLEGGTPPPLTGYLPCPDPDPSKGEAMWIIPGTRFDEIEDKLTKAYNDATSNKFKSVPHACIWHRNTPYETQLSQRVPEKVAVTIQQPDSEIALIPNNVTISKDKSIPYPDMASDKTGADYFWNDSVGHPAISSTSKHTSTWKFKADDTDSTMTDAEFFQMMQVSDPVASDEDANKGILLMYTLDPEKYTIATDDTIKPDRRSYLYVPDPNGTQTDPGIIESWSTGLTSPDGSEGSMTINGDGSPAIPTLKVKPFPMSVDVGTVPLGCEQSVMMCGKLSDQGSAATLEYSPLGLGDLTNDSKESKDNRPRVTKSGLDVNTANKVERAMLPNWTIPGPGRSTSPPAPWSEKTAAQSPYVNPYSKTFQTGGDLENAWTVVGLRQPKRRKVPTPTGLRSQLDGDGLCCSVDDPGISDPTSCGGAGVLETWVPAWYVGGQLVNQPSSVPNPSKNSDLPMAAQANSVMQFMVLDRPPVTRQLYGGMKCYVSAACQARVMAAKSFIDILEFCGADIVLIIVAVLLTELVGMAALIIGALGTFIGLAMAYYVQSRYSVFSVGLDSATFVYSDKCPKPPATCDLY